MFDVLISRSSRRWFAEQCDRNYLRERYVAADRLRDLPPFESLPPNRAPYHGLLTVFRIGLSETGITSRVLQHYVSAEKIMHAASVGDQVVVCFDGREQKRPVSGCPQFAHAPGTAELSTRST